MKPSRLILVLLAVLATGAALYFGRHRDVWHVEPSAPSDLVLSVASDGAGAATLKIYCTIQATEVRLYLPIRGGPSTGGADGPQVLNASDDFQDHGAPPSVPSAPAAEPAVWTVSEDGTYAWRSDAPAFIGQLFAHDGLRVDGAGFRGERLNASSLSFPLIGLAAHRDQITKACRAPALARPE
ncbi:hypothetical protein [Phenylobacterium aquaticum]|uniref:hypothetical protein n=1 Tax=Phenylobacterium aquaticum TaxID=1763816 RepID=UPI0026F306E4|nr:hypothetical protein [Phenylobacterium aquaticum]